MAENLTSIAARLAHADATMLEVVDRVGVALRSGACETVEGLPVDLWLTNVCRLPGGEAWFLRQAADVLRHLPATHQLWRDRVLVWGQVRRIVARARRLSIARRTELDARIGASADRFRSMDPDHVIDAVERAATEIEGSARAERAEDRRAEDEFLAVQPDFDGGIRLYGELGPLSGAIVTNALDARTGRREHDDTDPGRPSSRAKEDAAALVSMCADDLAGGDRDGPAKPLVVVGVQLGQVDVTAAGTLDLDVPGVLPTVTARTLEALAQDADLRAVIFDGATPLAVSKRTTAPDIPADTRLAVWLRDRTCRFPGSRRPASSSHVHHLLPRAHGGDHHPDNLALVADTVHTGVLHRHGWRTRLDPDDGALIATRGDRTLRSLPRWRGLDRRDPTDDRDPPG